MRRGFSMLMCAPDERRVVRALLGSLGRRKWHFGLLQVDLLLTCCVLSRGHRYSGDVD
jgi:ATP-dependent RNA helicase DDX24/MAK5